jgi:hypothetical protein
MPAQGKSWRRRRTGRNRRRTERKELALSGQHRRLVSNTVTAEVMHAEPAGRRWWVFLGPMALVALVLSFVIPSARHEWALSVFRQPTRYTALSFNKAWALPGKVIPYQPIDISFTINNQEGDAESYRYVVIQTSAGLSSTLRKSAKTVAPGRSWTVSTVIRPTCLFSPCRIEVSLPGHPETIDFLAAVKA